MSAAASRKRLRARALTRNSRPRSSTTNCGTVPTSKLRTRSDVSRGSLPVSAAMPPRGGIARGESGMRSPITERDLVNTRRRRSIGVNIVACASIVSARPRKRNPPSLSAKWKRARIFACVGPSKYISVLRQASRSTREIGASFTRSLRPKITQRRRSFRK